MITVWNMDSFKKSHITIDKDEKSLLNKKRVGDKCPTNNKVNYSTSALNIKYNNFITPLLKEKYKVYLGNETIFMCLDVETCEIDKIQWPVAISVTYKDRGGEVKTYFTYNLNFKDKSNINLWRDLFKFLITQGAPNPPPPPLSCTGTRS